MNGHPPGSDGIEPGDAPTGVIVGTAAIARCERAPHNGHYCWHLSGVRRIKPRKPKRMPQPVWFRPF